MESLESKEKERQEYRSRMVDAIRRLHAYETTDERPARGAKRRPGQHRLTGLGASPGFGRGHAHLLHPEVSLDHVEERHVGDADAERTRLAHAVERSVEEMVRLEEKMHTVAPEIDGAIFDAQRMMLEDSSFLGKITARLDEGLAAESALKQVIDEYVMAFLAVTDGYLRERAADVRDIGQRLLRNLLGHEERERGFAGDVVLVAHDLTLTDLSLMEHDRLKGIVLATGRRHLARLDSRQVVRDPDGGRRRPASPTSSHEGDEMIVDGNSGVVYVNPGVDVSREYQRLAAGVSRLQPRARVDPRPARPRPPTDTA